MRKWYGTLYENSFIIQRSLGGKYIPLSAVAYGRIVEQEIIHTKIKVIFVANPLTLFILLFMCGSILIDSFVNPKAIEFENLGIMTILIGYSIFDIYLTYAMLKSQLKIY